MVINAFTDGCFKIGYFTVVEANIHLHQLKIEHGTLTGLK